MEIFCLLAGVLFAYTGHYYLFVFIAFVCIIQWRLSGIFLFFLACLYALAHQWWVSSTLPLNSDVLQAKVIGRIHSISFQTPEKKQFYFKTEEINGKKIKTSLLLSWYHHPSALNIGEQWQFQVKLKKPHNLGNPGAFNYVQWLSSHHLQWTGYVKNHSGILLSTGKDKDWPFNIRENIAKHIRKAAPNLQTAGILQALTIGLTKEIEPQLWDLFRRTGTTHLMVISGAHIGLIAGMIFALTKWLWRRNFFLCLRWPAVRAASITSLFSALMYALLAGFAVPAQRACIGCFFFSLQYLGGQKYGIWQIWRYALLFVLLFEPHSVLMPGFYLSFVAVAVLITAHQRWPVHGIKKIILAQLVCLIGLMPLTIYWFSYGSVTGFIANVFAIPLVGFFIVPLALVMLLFLPFAAHGLFMQALTVLIALLLKILYWVDWLSVFNVSLSFNQIIIPLSLMAAIFCLVLLPISSYKILAFILILLALFLPYQKIKSGELLVNILDVSQGLAAVIQTQNHVLIYDTGDQFYQGSDMAKLAILPFLKSQQVTSVDKIVISHPDKDHRGGLKSLESAMPVQELIVNDRKYYHRGLSCHHYPSWRWDGVDFRFFPIKKRFKEKNNRSCILQISHPNGRILFTGDIEKKAEDYLFSRYGQELQSDVLLVPHHGSKTSSSDNFLRKVKPKYAIVSLGQNNRFHFPHAEVVQRYKAFGVPLLQTKDCGMVTVKLNDSKEWMPVCYTKMRFD
ncbi:DNA internalization-related competence protein ComEC/Rec2 [Legionella israelensis]|uniref:DNA internalization-related competence protein ComEC/Rec2 n=1 Tax=Legionella israelensis TaxID=454 RepID=A0AAX1EGE7_9GAMM|nr:DNA internalization-related competence protein ComEC/Rec2 [Legionella israelensis]QBR83889.1 DNA internalization-related competence protein ComEC/Rec2 [Legionella israelensis]